MPTKSLSEPSFIRVAEIMGSTIQTALSKKADDVADMVADGIKRKRKTPINEAKKLVQSIYDESGLVEANRKRLVRIMNRGADEVADSAILKRQGKQLGTIIDKLNGVVKRSADNYLDRIVMTKVAKKIANGGSPEDVRQVVKKSMDDAEHYWKNVSNTASSRIFHYGSMIAAQNAGLKKCTYHAVIDDATTDFCRAIDGKTVNLGVAIVKAETLLMQSEEDMMSSEFWDTVNGITRVSGASLLKNGLTLPPFHGHCRTTTWFT
jgi:SPP1 gp7 family putative phage head morphogenesis protein